MAYSSFYARAYDLVQNTSKSFNLVIKFVSTKYYFIAILILQILAWFQAYNIIQNVKGDFLILHYNVDFGVDLVGEPSRILFFPLAGLLIVLLNFILSAALSRKQGSRIIFHLFFSASILLNTFLNLALFAIYLINFQ